MKKFILMLVVLISTCTNSFGYINVPKDSIPYFVSETAQKNNIQNPDLIFPKQEMLIYLGSYVKLPVLVIVEKGDNLTKIIKNIIIEVSPLEQSNRNWAYDSLQGSTLLASVVNNTIQQQKDPTIPPAEVIWSITGLIALILIIAFITSKLKEYK